MRIVGMCCAILMSHSLVGENHSINCITNNGIIYRCLNGNKLEVVGRVDGWDCGDLLIPRRVRDWNVRGVGESAFADDLALRSVWFEEGVWKVGDRAFKGCVGIVKVDLPESLSVLGHEAFCGCSNIKEVRLPGSLDYGGSCVFKGCDSLNRLVVADGLSCDIVPMLYGCAGLGDIEVGNNKKYRMIDGCLYDSSGRVFIKCPVKFQGPELHVRDGVKGIADCALYGCKGVKKVEFQQGLSEIGSAAFSCSGIEEVEFPEGVSYVGMEAFAGCTNLHSVVFPRSIEYVGLDCFAGASGLRRIVFNGNRPEVEKPEFSIGAKECVLMVSKGACGWSDKEQIWGIPVRFCDLAGRVKGQQVKSARHQ